MMFFGGNNLERILKGKIKCIYYVGKPVFLLHFESCYFNQFISYCTEQFFLCKRGWSLLRFFLSEELEERNASFSPQRGNIVT